MKDYGFLRVAAAVPVVSLADPATNAERICSLIEEAFAKQVSVVVFPELCVTGYSCGDLFGQQYLLDEAEKAVVRIMEFTRGKDVAVVVGVPVRFNDRLYNCAAVLWNGSIKGIVSKTYLPTYNEFYESRWFASGRDFLNGNYALTGRYLSNGKDTVREGFASEIRYAGFRCNISPNMLFKVGKATFAIEICEDMWSPIPPSSYHCLSGAQVVLNLSASNEVLFKSDYRRELISQLSGRTMSAYVYCSAGAGESSQDLVFGGAALVAENGSIIAENERFNSGPSMVVADVDIEKLSTLRQKTSTFMSVTPDGTRSSSYKELYSIIELGSAAATDFSSELLHPVNPYPFLPQADEDVKYREIISMQVTGLASRLRHIGCKSAVVGISGGLDSTLALLVAVLAFDKAGLDRKGLVGVTMPGYGTTDRTYSNALDLMKGLGITSREIPIAAACDRHFLDIGHDKNVHDITYENTQARERTQILMDIANQTGGIVVGTGDLSEMALGWATYNGDHMSMYAVNSGISKTLVRHLVKCISAFPEYSVQEKGERPVSEILADILDTPVSPELLPAGKDGEIAQITEDVVGPYELHDFYIYNFFKYGYSPEKLLFLAGKAFPDYDKEVLQKWLRTFLRRFFVQQFKRSCMPDGPKVCSVSFSPRGDWRMPSDASVRAFLESLDK